MNVPAPLPANFFILGSDAAHQVFEHLSDQDLGRLAQANSTMYNLVKAYRENDKAAWDHANAEVQRWWDGLTDASSDSSGEHGGEGHG